MVDQTNIFEGKEESATTETQEAQAFKLPEVANELIGEGKKYESLDKALESLPHKEKHIQTLESELAELRKKLEASTSVEDALKKLTQGGQEQERQTSQPVDLNEIAQLVDQRLVEKERTQLQQNNVKTVVSKLTEQFGGKEKAEQVFMSKAEELGVDVGYLNDLAATSPKAVFALFGSDSAPKSSDNFAKSSVNSASFNSTPKQEKPTPRVMNGASTSDMVAAWREVTAHITGD